jgi:hypothetical protein
MRVAEGGFEAGAAWAWEPGRLVAARGAVAKLTSASTSPESSASAAQTPWSRQGEVVARPQRDNLAAAQGVVTLRFNAP